MSVVGPFWKLGSPAEDGQYGMGMVRTQFEEREAAAAEARKGSGGIKIRGQGEVGSRRLDSH